MKHTLVQPALVTISMACAPALAQPNFAYELRFSPTAPDSLHEPGLHGFWVEARVRQDAGRNFGLFGFGGGASPSTIEISDPAGQATLQRGIAAQNSLNIAWGCSVEFPVMTAPAANSPTGNHPESVPFPGAAGNANGSFDGGATRLFGMAARRSSTRGWAPLDGDPPVPTREEVVYFPETPADGIT